MTTKTDIRLGWKEYAALPELGIDRIHMKIDTGAKTSAIHTTEHHTFELHGKPWVKFTVAPHQDDDDTTVSCEMPVKDQRTITSSNGHSSKRIVVETLLRLGSEERMIELTLVCRKSMRFRMLLGRQAMHGMVVCPDLTHLTTQPEKHET